MPFSMGRRAQGGSGAGGLYLWITLAHGGLRPFHQKSTCLRLINFRALCGAKLVTSPLSRWAGSPQAAEVRAISKLPARDRCAVPSGAARGGGVAFGPHVLGIRERWALVCGVRGSGFGGWVEG